MEWRIQQIYIYGTLLVSAFLLIYLTYRGRNTKSKNEFAVKQGWLSYKQNVRAQKAGFETPEAYHDGVKLGFLNQKAQQFLYSSGFNSADSMVMYSQNVKSNINYFLESDADLMNKKMIYEIKTLEQLSNLENHLQPYFVELNQLIAKANRILSIQTSLLTLFQTENAVLFTTLRHTQLENQKRVFENIKKKLKDERDNLNSEFVLRKDWFTQWQSYMSPMWITGNQKIISLKNISSIINASLDAEEYRLLNLLDSQKQKQSIEVNPFLEKELGFQIIMLMQ